MKKKAKMFNMNRQSEDCMTPEILKGRDLMKKSNQRRMGTALLTALMTMSVTIGSINTGSFFSENLQITASASQQDDIISVALGEEGYEEGANNWTKYGDWYGMNNVAWCAIFISWCANQAGISQDVIHKNAWAGDMEGSECTGNFGGHYYPRSLVLNGTYTPTRGDIVYYDGSDVNGSSGHVELVVDYDPFSETITSIGGNTGGGYRVYKHTGQSLHTNGTSMTITGFEHPDYSTEPDLIINDEPIAPYPRPVGYVREGDKSLYVGWVQYCLFKQLGYGDEDDVIDCDFGPVTLMAVTTFQEDYRLEVDGIVGPETVSKLVELISKPEPEPDPIPSGSLMSEGAGQTLPDGDYFIYSPLKENYYLDINGADVPAAAGTNVHMWTASRKPTAQDACDAWTLKYLNNGFYRISQKGTNMCLDVQDGSLLRGANCQVWYEHEDAPEQWSISKTSNGYKIQARCSGFCLDIASAETSDGTNTRVWEDNDSMAQRFIFVPYTVEEETTTATTTAATTTTTTTAVASETSTPVVLRPGDVNTDKTVDVADAVLLARFIVEDPEVMIPRAGLTAADINADGKISLDDIMMILQMIAKIL